MSKKFSTIRVSQFADELIADLEEARQECALLDPLSQREEFFQAYSKLSRHRKLLYQYLSELELWAAGKSAVVTVHLSKSTHKRF